MATEAPVKAEAPATGPPPPSAPQHQPPPQQYQPTPTTPVASNGAAPPPPPPVDGKAYYGYLFTAKKEAAPKLDALLRAIGIHIVGFSRQPGCHDS